MPRIAWLGAALTAAAVLLLGGFDLESVDLGYHLAYGRWMLEHGAVLTVKTFSSVHPEHPFVNDKWAFQVVLAAVEPLGPAALVGLRVLLIAMTAALLLGWMLERAPAGSPVPWAVTLLALWTMGPRLMLRPELPGYTLMLAVAWRLERLRRIPDGSWRWLLPLVALQVVWVNTHGSFPFGPCLAGAVGVAGLLPGRDRPPAPRRAFVAAAAMGAACLLNPHGWRVLTYPLEMHLDLRDDPYLARAITEFAPTLSPLPVEPSWRLTWAALLVASTVATLAALRRRADAYPLILLLAFGGLSLSMRRHVALFAPIGAWLIATSWPVGVGGARARKAGWLALVLVAVPALAAVATDRVYLSEQRVRRTGWGRSPLVGAPDAVAFARAQLLAAYPRYGNAGNLGGWLMGELPDHPPLLDHHTNSQPVAFRREVMAATIAGAPLDPLSRAYGIHWWFVGTGAHADVALLAKLTRSPGWQPAFAGPRAIVFVDTSRPDLAALARAFAEATRARDEAATDGMPTPGAAAMGWRPRHDKLAGWEARVMFELRYHGLARAALTRALAVARWDPRLLSLAGEMAERAGDLDGARAWFAAALTRQSDHATAHANLGRLLLSGDREAGLRHLRAAFAAAPQRPAIALLLVDALGSDREAARAVVERARSYRPDSAALKRAAERLR